MFRCTSTNTVASKPAYPTGQTEGFFAHPDPDSGVPATTPGWPWYQRVTEELIGVITAAGGTPDQANDNQLAASIISLIQQGAHGVTVSPAVFAPAVTGLGKPVYWDAANSRFDLAVADGTVKQNVVGFADVPGTQVFCFGTGAIFSGLTSGSRYYLDPVTAGVITTSPNANGVFLGTARSASVMFIDIDDLGVRANQQNVYTVRQVGETKAVASSGGALTLDLPTSNNFDTTLSENTNLAAPTNPRKGTGGVIYITQHAAAAKTLTFHSFWYFPAGVPSMPATLGAVCAIAYSVDPLANRAICVFHK